MHEGCLNLIVIVARYPGVLCFVCMTVRQQGRTEACCNCDMLFSVMFFFCMLGRAEVAIQAFQAVETGRFAFPQPSLGQTHPFYLSCPPFSFCPNWMPASNQRQQRVDEGSAEGCPDVAVSARG